MTGRSGVQERAAVCEAVEHVRTRLERGELEFTEDDVDVRLLLARFERVRQRAGSPRVVALSPYLESALGLR